MLRKFRLGPKLMGGFVLVALLCAFVGYEGISTMNEVGAQLRTMVPEHINPMNGLRTINDLFSVDIVGCCHKLNNGNIGWPEAQKTIGAARAAIAEEWKGFLGSKPDEAERKLISELEILLKSASSAFNRLEDILQRKDKEQLDHFVVRELYSLTDPILETIISLNGYEMKYMKSGLDDSLLHFHSARQILAIVVALCVVTAILLGFFLTRSIARPAGKMAAAAKSIAMGDIDQHIEYTSQDEIGSLADSFRSMIDYIKGVALAANTLSLGDVTGSISPKSDKDLLSMNFIDLTAYMRNLAAAADAVSKGDLTVAVNAQSANDVLGNAFIVMVDNLKKMNLEVREAATVLASSISQISAITTQLASSSTETATAVSETTTTAEEVRQTSQIASEKARYVAESAHKVMQISHTGKKATDDTIEGMNRIREQMGSIADSIVRLSEQSQAIGEIITTVNDLADQSNLLAVNASIEAAKAGEEGKGFVVVAQEIRSLAEQSKQATAQVKNILNDIQKATSSAVMATEKGSKAVEDGVKRSAQSGESIVVLGASISEASQAATQIAASTQQQLVGMDQVALAMENIQRASTQNVESARQLESAAHGLNDLGQKLKLLVDRHRV